MLIKHPFVNNRNVRTPANVAALQASLAANPNQSARRNNVPQLSKSTFNRITRDVNMRPYRVQLRQKLQRGDLARRLEYSQWFNQQALRHRFLTNILVLDEAAFHMNGKVNTWNTRMYAPQRHPPADFTFDVSTDRRKVTVLAVMCGDNHLIGPIFIVGNLNGQAYLDIINNQVVPQLRAWYGQQRQGAIPRKYWLQDGAPAHRRRDVTARLQVLFPHRVVALGQQPEFPPRSPDLTPLDFFLWGHIKDRVYNTVPADLPELRRRITQEFVALRRAVEEGSQCCPFHVHPCNLLCQAPRWAH